MSHPSYQAPVKKPSRSGNERQEGQTGGKQVVTKRKKALEGTIQPAFVKCCDSRKSKLRMALAEHLMPHLEAFEDGQRDARDVVLPGPDLRLSLVHVLKNGLRREMTILRLVWPEIIVHTVRCTWP